MEFKSVPNKCVETVDGEKIWVSRSMAVVSEVILRYQGHDHVLMVERGPACDDFVGRWCLPCGYLDWNEDGASAAMRETWEETGINLPDLILSCALQSPSGQAGAYCYNNFSPRHPRTVDFGAGTKRENVTLHYTLYGFTDKLPIPQVRDPKEVTHAQWVKISSALTLPLAFDHYNTLRTLREACDYWRKIFLENNPPYLQS